MQDFTSVDSQVLSDPHWRERLHRDASAALMRAGSTHAVIARTYSDLLAKVPPENTHAAAEAMSKLVRVMNAFADLSQQQKDALLGVVHDAHIGRLNGVDQIKYTQKLRLEVWRSHPALSELQDEVDAEAARVDALAAEQRAARQAADEATRKRKTEAPGIVIDWHNRGFRLDVAEDGGAMVWPASLLTPDDRAVLASHGKEIGQAIRAEWTKS